MKKITQSKLFYIAAALLASICLWLYVVGVENPETTMQISGIDVEFIGVDTILADRDLTVVSNGVTQVDLVFYGKRTELNKLTKDNISVQVDLSNIVSAGDYNFEYTVTLPSSVKEGSVTITEKSPSNYVSVTIGELVTKSVEVDCDFVGDIAEGYSMEGISCSPEKITIKGPETLISRVTRAKVVLNRTNVDKTIVETLSYTLFDENGQEITSKEITSDVKDITVTLTVLSTKNVRLTVNIIEGGGATEANIFVGIEPDTVELKGDAAILEAVDKIVLGNIDLSSFKESETYEYSVPLPEGTQFTSGEDEITVKVTVDIKGLETKTLRTNNIVLVHVPENYTTTLVTQSLSVVVRGPSGVIDDIESTNVRVVADLSDLNQATGNFKVPVKVYIDGSKFSEAGVVGDYSVSVKITEPASSTDESEVAAAAVENAYQVIG